MTDFIGKVPPQAVDIEQAVLSAVMINSKALLNVLEKFKPELFYKPIHASIAKAICELSQQGQAIDILTISDHLKKAGELERIGGYTAVADISGKVASSAHIENHIDILIEKYIIREMAKVCNELGEKAYSEGEDASLLVGEMEYRAAELQRKMLTGNIRSLSGIASEVWERKGSSGYVKSKHRAINENFGGWRKGTLNIIAGRPGMGKSAFHVSELLSCVQTGSTAMSFNLEMMETQLIPRMECNLSGIGNKKYKDHFSGARPMGYGEYDTLMEARKMIMAMEDRLFLDFTGGISVFDITARAKKVKMETGKLDIIFVDHIQFVTVPAEMRKGMTRDLEIGIITRELKRFAKNEDVAVIAFSHLSRRTEDNKTKRPSLADLRESGNIENDADTISFLLRPEYYFEKDHTGSIIYDTPEKEEYKGICQFICDKNRDGTTFEDDLKVSLANSSFSDLSRKEPISVSLDNKKEEEFYPF